MARYVVVDKEGKVINVIIWDGIAKWSPPDGCTLALDENQDININDVWDENLKKFNRIN